MSQVCVRKNRRIDRIRGSNDEQEQVDGDEDAEFRSGKAFLERIESEVPSGISQ